MSDLSPELRIYYEGVLSRSGGSEALAASAIIYAVVFWIESRFIDNSTYRGLAYVVGLIVIVWYHRDQRRDEIERQRIDAHAMPDDRLAAAYGEHQKSAQRVGIFWVVAGIAIAFGLLFTVQGNVYLGEFLNGLSK